MQKIPRHRTGRVRTTAAVLRRPYEFYSETRASYGRTVLIKALNGDVVVSGDPENVRRIFAADPMIYAPFAEQTTKGLLGSYSIFQLSGPAHRNERGILMPPLHGDRMRAYTDAIVAATERQAREWKSGDEIVAIDAALRITMEVILEVVFGVQKSARIEAYCSAIEALTKSANPVLLFSKIAQVKLAGLGPWDRFLKARDGVDTLIYEDIERRRADPGEDILSLLIAARYPDGCAMADEAIRDELVTLLFAGHETTSIATSWAMHWLHSDADCLARLREELRGTGDDATAISKAPWLDACIKETLRLNPILPDVLRTLVEPIELAEGTVPAGKGIAAAQAMTHYDPEIFEDPERFNPERFLERKFRPWEYYPFGGGARRCAGAALATWELKFVLATLLRDNAFEAIGEPPKAARRNATMGPDNGVPMRML